MDSVLVRLTDSNPSDSGASGLLIEDKYVFITSHLLLPYINKEFFVNSKNVHKNAIIFRNKIENAPNLSSSINLSRCESVLTKIPKFTVQYIQECSEHVLENNVKDVLDNTVQCVSKNGILKEIAQPVFCISYPLLHDFLKAQLKDCTVDDNKENNVILKSVLSHIFILELDKNRDNAIKGDVMDFKECLNTFIKCKVCNSFDVGDEIFVKSTPFGLDKYFNSYTHGIVSNMFFDRSLLLIDSPLVQGCEGGDIFVKKSKTSEKVIGIVICCLISWQNSSTGLALGINLVSLFHLLIDSQQPVLGNELNIIYDLSCKALAQVVDGVDWGTACLINKNRGILITNSHVITRNTVTLHWNGAKFKALVIYKSHDNKPYDIAILKVPDTSHLKHMKELAISTRKVNVGDAVWAAGFPIFQKHFNPKPTITKGHISKINKTVIITTCTVLPGCSGGPVFNKYGQIEGVVVANVKDGDVCFPRVNFIIPIREICCVIEEYLKSGDERVLNELQVENVQKNFDWNLVVSKL